MDSMRKFTTKVFTTMFYRLGDVLKIQLEHIEHKLFTLWYLQDPAQADDGHGLMDPDVADRSNDIEALQPAHPPECQPVAWCCDARCDKIPAILCWITLKAANFIVNI